MLLSSLPAQIIHSHKFDHAEFSIHETQHVHDINGIDRSRQIQGGREISGTQGASLTSLQGTKRALQAKVTGLPSRPILTRAYHCH